MHTDKLLDYKVICTVSALELHTYHAPLLDQLFNIFQESNVNLFCVVSGPDYSYTVRDECSVLEQRLSSIDQLNKATCRVLSSQLTRYVWAH